MSRSRLTAFLRFFAIFYAIIFVDIHFLAFFPLTIRDPIPLGRSAVIALFGALCAGLYAASRKSN
jgi:hypothetical protein